ncbi:MAG TPA: metallophosphoesterase family protein [Burkholderiaceae bacterium]|nr:metallophosphoesterase family protein [Burkholderiaceae bacterium]
MTAVRGNNDRAPWASMLPATAILQVAAAETTITLCVVHDLATLDFEPHAAGCRIVVHGHSHRPAVEWRGPVLYVNPGSAGPRRFSLPISLARLRIDADSIDAAIDTLPPEPPASRARPSSAARRPRLSARGGPRPN